MDLLDEIVEKPELAPKRYRVFAAIIDFIILMTIGYFIGKIFGQSYTEQNKVGFNLTGVPAFLFFLIGFVLIPLNEGLFGQTIGKRILKIKVVRKDLTKTTLSTSIIRHLFDLVDCFFLLGLIVASSNKYNQRVGDLVAKTYVVEK